MKKTVLVFDSRERFIWLDGWITPEMASRFKRILDRLNRKSAPIVLYIRGMGGDPHSAFNIMSDMNNSISPISVVAHNYVASACFTITQAGDYRLAMKGTRFSFHPAVLVVQPKKESFEMTQEELMGTLESLRLTDGVQLSWFFKKGRPVKDIFNLFNTNTTINLPRAKRLKIMDDYYKERDFLRDRRIVRKKLVSGQKRRK